MNYTNDIATRVYNHTWSIDPIIRSLIDSDFYKLLMCQLIWQKHFDVNVTFGLKNRSTSVCIADDIDECELRAQLDHARTVKLSRGESTYLRGNTFYGKRQIFSSEFVDWLEKFQLPEYELHKDEGQYVLRFHGRWCEATLWEIPALAIINELRSRTVLNKLSRFEIDVVYARAKAKLWSKVERIKKLSDEGYQFKIADFGSRRRHSFLFQRWAVQALQEGLGNTFIGTSNTLLAMTNDMEAIGSNAHEIPMTYAALANNNEELAEAPYNVLRDWQEMYHGNLLVALPDAFGTTEFLKKAPDWLANWKGIRPDSRPWKEGTEEAIAYWKSHGQNPKEKLVILSDGMDIDSIEQSVKMFSNQTNISIGFGTNLTNDFAGCMPEGTNELKAISLVCKVVEANGRPAVKLSDNIAKAMGDPSEIERYKRVFNYDNSDNRVTEV